MVECVSEGDLLAWWVAVGKTSAERLKSIRDGGFLIVREKSELGKCGMRMWWLRNVF